MSKSPEQQNTILLSWWVRLCRWLWAQRGFIWGTLITGILISIIATWLTTQTSIFTGTPLGIVLLWIYDNLPLAGFIGLSLFLLTVLVGVVSHLPDIPTPSVVIFNEKSRADLIDLLSKEYRRQKAESLQEITMMELELQTRTDVVPSSVSLVSWRMDALGDHPSPPPASIMQAYEDSGGRLLILGDPGVGKSTLLRELASKLLTRAKNDATERIPVIVNLSTWAIKKPPLATWMVDRLWETYNIPPRLSQACIEKDKLLFLLDGLDEVKPSALTDCIEAINSYLEKQEQIVPIVVCSQYQVYQKQQERLRLPVAVEVRPLTPEQVDRYLKDVGEPVAAARTALKENAILCELVTTPLMLNVIILAYRGKTIKDLPQPGSAEQQHQVLEQYVKLMLEQPTRTWNYSPKLTKKCLSSLARQMQHHHLTEFYLEYLQYSCWSVD
jgi:DNA polymerase III delta prime subunit